MLKLFNRKKKDNKGFTLVELVIVIAILAILVGLLASAAFLDFSTYFVYCGASNMDEMVKIVKVFAADPANELAKGDYTITIPTTGTASIKKDTTPIETTDKLYIEFNNSIPKWTSTNTKSKKWGADGATASISATVTVAEDGGTSVKYFTGDKYAENNKFEKYMLNGSEE